MPRRIACLAVIAATLLFWAPAWAGTGSAGLSAALQRATDNYLRSRSKVEHISAVSLSISFPGSGSNLNIVSGTTKYGGGGAITPTTLFQIGSNTKAFTAAALLQLEAEGKLTIDQTVGDWLPQYPAWSKVSIRRLLDMTSGIPGYDNVAAMGHAESTIHRHWTPAMLVGFVDPAYGHAPPPTTGWDYSNTNYILAGMIIERASGNSYASELKRRFFEPLGLKDTFYSDDLYPKSVLDRQLSGYFMNTSPGNEPLAQLLGVDVRTMDMSWAGAAGGIVATPEDVTHWVRALYKGDLLASKQRRELMSIVSIRTGKPIATTTLQDPLGFGLGVGHATKPKIGTFWYYQGETLGYRVVYAWFPKSDVVIGVGLNSQPPTPENHVGVLLEDVWSALHATGKL